MDVEDCSGVLFNGCCGDHVLMEVGAMGTAAAAATGALGLAIAAVVATLWGRRALLHVTVDPPLRLLRALPIRLPTTRSHLRAEWRYLRARYHCWRRGY